MNHHNPYARIQEYFSLLSASMDYTDRSDNGISMQQICENTQIPAKIVRNDFLTIFQWQRSMNLVKNSDKNELAVLFYDKSPKYQKICDTYALDELYDNYMDAVPGNDSIQKFEQLITDGILDAVPIIFTILTQALQIPGHCPLLLTKPPLYSPFIPMKRIPCLYSTV